MRKVTSTIIGLTIATILTAYISALTLSNQAFACCFYENGQYVLEGTAHTQSSSLGVTNAKITAHLGQELEGHSLGDGTNNGNGKILAGRNHLP